MTQGLSLHSPDGAVVLTSDTVCYKLSGIYTSFVDQRVSSPYVGAPFIEWGPYMHTHYVDVTASSLPKCFIDLPLISTVGNTWERPGLAITHYEHLGGTTWRIYLAAGYANNPTRLFVFERIGANELGSDTWGLRVFSGSGNSLFDSGFTMLHTLGPGKNVNVGKGANSSGISFAQTGSSFSDIKESKCMAAYTVGAAATVRFNSPEQLAVFRPLFSYSNGPAFGQGGAQVRAFWTLIAHADLGNGNPFIYDGFAGPSAGTGVHAEFIKRSDFL